MSKSYHTLRLILGDQLNHEHSWYQTKDSGVLYFMAEMKSETGYVKHHIQKVVGFFLAMRHFAQHLQEEGHDVLYFNLDDQRNHQSITGNILSLIQAYQIQQFEYQLPDEYRLDLELQKLCGKISIESASFDTEHFLTKRNTVEDFFKGKKTYLLETFYRNMRKQYNLLMEADGTTPLTGQWNYDQDNRKKLPKQQDIPKPLHFRRDATEVVELLEKENIQTIGHIDPERFNWPVTRKENLELLAHFFKIRLHLFGTYQDAMTDRDYLLFHSKLSFAMNTKLLSPLEIVEASIAYWQDHQSLIDISQIEGFIRQIIGWREFMRGIYWAKMPDYANLNFFSHDATLPEWYWTGKTEMKCLHTAINQSLDHAYAHHIQRLMVTGNFALLLGVHP
ncbi:MAG: cryptochrome/photolyase family protein, partial [Phaeodactylibacter sp.]|nr:cryptochrome/photolyase family protein [Phaeodactylibacter sp.]